MLEIFWGALLGSLAANALSVYLLRPEPEFPFSQKEDEVKIPYQDPVTGEFVDLSIEEWGKRQQIASKQNNQSNHIEEVLEDLRSYVRVKPNGTRK